MLKIFTNKESREVKAYLMIDDATKMCILVDTGLMEIEINEYLQTNQLILKLILITHTHWDHYGGLKQILDANVHVEKVLVGKDDLVNLNDINLNLSALFTANKQKRNSGLNIHDSRFEPLKDKVIKLKLLSWTFYAIHTPGHTPGGYIYWNPEQNLLFTGDTLMANGIGATDKKLGSKELLENSLFNIAQMLKPHPEMLVMPGHHSYASFGQVMEHNDFFRYIVENHNPDKSLKEEK